MKDYTAIKAAILRDAIILGAIERAKRTGLLQTKEQASWHLR